MSHVRVVFIAQIYRSKLRAVLITTAESQDKAALIFSGPPLQQKTSRQPRFRGPFKSCLPFSIVDLNDLSLVRIRTVPRGSPEITTSASNLRPPGRNYGAVSLPALGQAQFPFLRATSLPIPTTLAAQLVSPRRQRLRLAPTVMRSNFFPIQLSRCR